MGEGGRHESKLISHAHVEMNVCWDSGFPLRNHVILYQRFFTVARANGGDTTHGLVTFAFDWIGCDLDDQC